MMVLEELLNAKDEAVAHADAMRADLEAARQALAEAERADAEAIAGRDAAHKAIHDLLMEKGVSSIISGDGTITIYQAMEEGVGWMSFHPTIGNIARDRLPKDKSSKSS